LTLIIKSNNNIISLKKEKSRRKEHKITKNVISLDAVEQIMRLLAAFLFYWGVGRYIGIANG